MKILITGTPGSGKTTLVKYAKSLSDKRFYDADELVEICEWREFKTGRVLGLVSEMEQMSDDHWFKNNGWYWREPQLKQFLEANDTIFLCGSSENVVDCYDLFDKIVVLNKTEQDLVKNLQSPDRSNPFGKTTKQREGFMEWQSYLIREAKLYNPVLISGNDTAKAYEQIVGLSS